MFRFGEADYRLGIANSPSDRNVAWLKRQDLRRVLGLAGQRRVGCRRTASPRRRPAPPLLLLWPESVFLPDWRDALRRHPVYLAFRAAGALAADRDG